MPRRYKPVPWHLRKKRPKGYRTPVQDLQYLSDGRSIKLDAPAVDDEIGEWIDKHWGGSKDPLPVKPEKPKGPPHSTDLRYYVSATEGSTAFNAEFDGFGVFDSHNREMCVFASYTPGPAERRCKLMNAVHLGELVRYALVQAPKGNDYWHVVDIYHDTKWCWGGRKQECEAMAKLLNEREKKR